MSGFRKKVLQGFGWRAATDIGQQILQIIFTAILAHLLTKTDFGVVAMALIYTRFIRSVTQVGFSTAIIQDQKISQEHLSALFLYSLASSLLISAICFFSAPFAANFFNEPNLIPVVQVLSGVIFISALSFPQIFMRKNLEFKKLSILEMSSMLLGNLLGIVMAFTGWGIWSLVGRLMLQRILLSSGIWIFTNWRPSKPKFKGLSRYFKFGLNMLGAHIVYFFSQNLVGIITGRYIGAEILGAYSIAYNLAIVPAQKVQSVLTSVLTPAFSRIQEMTDRFNSRLQLSVFSLGLVFIPAMFGLSTVAESLVILIYGVKWEAAGSFLSILAFVGLTKGMEHLLRSSILSKGHPGKILKITITETAIGIPLYILAINRFGIQGLIFSYLVVSIIAFLMTVRYTQKIIKSPGFFNRATLRSFIAASAMYCSLLTFDLFIDPGIIMLFGKIIGGVLIYCAIRYLLLNQYERRIVYEIPLLGKLFVIK